LEIGAPTEVRETFRIGTPTWKKRGSPSGPALPISERGVRHRDHLVSTAMTKLLLFFVREGEWAFSGKLLDKTVTYRGQCWEVVL